jgi:hypothetical protein
MFRLAASQPLDAAEHGRVRAIEPPTVHPQQSRLEHHPADLNNPVGAEASNLGGPMVEIRVTVEDATRVPQLVQRLANLFERSSISFDGSRNEVRVESEWESRAVSGVVEAVQTWLTEDGGESATLSTGSHSYRMVSSTPLAVSR